MAFPFHVWITGQKAGKVSAGDGGVSDIQGREDSILAQALDHLVSIPRDIQTGLPTGKRIHQPLRITKYFDKSSPILYSMLCTGEQLTDVTIKFFRINPKGIEEHYFTIKLTDGIIVDIRAWVPQCLDPALGHLRHMEDVSFTYRKIDWTWEDGGITADDSWVTPRS